MSRGRDMREKKIRNSASNTPAYTPANLSAGGRSAKHGSRSAKNNAAFTPNAMAGNTPHGQAITPNGVFLQSQPLQHMISSIVKASPTGTKNNLATAAVQLIILKQQNNAAGAVGSGTGTHKSSGKGRGSGQGAAKFFSQQDVLAQAAATALAQAQA